MRELSLLLLLSFLIACSTSSDKPKIIVTHDNSIEGISNGLTQENMIFSISQTGGCMMAGPNCAEYQLNVNDGSFNLLRVQKNSVVEGKGKIDKKLVDEWFAELDGMNVPEFINALGEGECRACYDGVDIDYNVVDADFSIFALSSRDKGFDSSKRFFELSDKIYRQMYEQVQLEMKMRE